MACLVGWEVGVGVQLQGHGVHQVPSRHVCCHDGMAGLASSHQGRANLPHPVAHPMERRCLPGDAKALGAGAAPSYSCRPVDTQWDGRRPEEGRVAGSQDGRPSPPAFGAVVRGRTTTRRRVLLLGQ